MFVNSRLKDILYTQYLRGFCCSRCRLCLYFLEPLLSESGNRLWSSCGWLIFRQIGADGGASFLNRAQRVLIETQPQLENFSDEQLYTTISFLKISPGVQNRPFFFLCVFHASRVKCGANTRGERNERVTSL